MILALQFCLFQRWRLWRKFEEGLSGAWRMDVFTRLRCGQRFLASFPACRRERHSGLQIFGCALERVNECQLMGPGWKTLSQVTLSDSLIRYSADTLEPLTTMRRQSQTVGTTLLLGNTGPASWRGRQKKHDVISGENSTTTSIQPHLKLTATTASSYPSTQTASGRPKMRLLLKPQTIAASARVARLQQPRVFHAQIRRASTDPEKTDRPYGQPERRDPYGLPDLPEHGLPEHGMRPRQLPGTNTA